MLVRMHFHSAFLMRTHTIFFFFQCLFGFYKQITLCLSFNAFVVKLTTKYVNVSCNSVKSVKNVCVRTLPLCLLCKQSEILSAIQQILRGSICLKRHMCGWFSTCRRFACTIQIQRIPTNRKKIVVNDWLNCWFHMHIFCVGSFVFFLSRGNPILLFFDAKSWYFLFAGTFLEMNGLAIW